MNQMFSVTLTGHQLWEIRYMFREEQRQIEDNLRHAIARNDVLLIEIFTGRLSQINDLLSELPEL